MLTYQRANHSQIIGLWHWVYHITGNRPMYVFFFFPGVKFLRTVTKQIQDPSTFIGIKTQLTAELPIQITYSHILSHYILSLFPWLVFKLQLVSKSVFFKLYSMMLPIVQYIPFPQVTFFFETPKECWNHGNPGCCCSMFPPYFQLFGICCCVSPEVFDVKVPIRTQCNIPWDFFSMFIEWIPSIPHAC